MNFGEVWEYRGDVFMCVGGENDVYYLISLGPTMTPITPSGYLWRTPKISLTEWILREVR